MSEHKSNTSIPLFIEGLTQVQKSRSKEFVQLSQPNVSMFKRNFEDSGGKQQKDSGSSDDSPSDHKGGSKRKSLQKNEEEGGGGLQRLNSNHANESNMKNMSTHFTANDKSKHPEENSQAHMNLNYDGNGNPMNNNFFSGMPTQQPYSQDKTKITPGYTKYFIDENNPDYLGAKGLFTEVEIKEAFDTLDMNKNGYITAEELAFFLDVLNQDVQEEEIEEMIRLLDIDGNGQVKYEEFYKLGTGQSLAPIGQAFPPTFEMIERRKQIMSKADLSNKKNPSIDKGKFNSDEKSTLNNINVAKTNESQMNESINSRNQVERNLFSAGATGVSGFGGTNRKSAVQAFLKANSWNLKTMRKLHEKLIKQDKTSYICHYKQFLKFFEVQDNEVNKACFVAFSQNEEADMDLRHLIICIMGLQEISFREKLNLGFLCYDPDSTGFVNLNEMTKIIQMLQFSIDANKTEKKVRAILKKKAIDEDMISKDDFFDVLSEYQTSFF